MMIRYSVPAHFSEQHLKGLRHVASKAESQGIRIDNVYGSLPFSEVGHARHPGSIRDISDQSLADYISNLHSAGIRFHYTANAPWSDGLERLEPGRRRIQQEIGKLIDLGVDAFILANPYLLRLVRAWFPRVGLVASINMHAASSAAVENLLRLGADHVVLDRRLNRDFAQLRAITRAFADRVTVLVNSTCIPECPYQAYHALESAWFSRGGGAPPDVIEPDACLDYCLDRILSDPALMLAANWIRPEDVRRYAELGVLGFKIQGRSLPAAAQLQLIRAYAMDERTPGDRLMSLFPGLLDALRARAARVPGYGPGFETLGSIKSSALDALEFLESFAARPGGCSFLCSDCRSCWEAFEKLAERS